MQHLTWHTVVGTMSTRIQANVEKEIDIDCSFEADQRGSSAMHTDVACFFTMVLW